MHPKKACTCSQNQIAKYQKRISGPILDRIDLHIGVMPVDIEEFKGNQQASQFLEPSDKIRDRVASARKLQQARFADEGIHCNSQMKNSDIKKYCKLLPEVEQILRQASLKFNLSARSYMKVIKVARTISDLDNSKEIMANHMAEALQYKPRTYESA